MAADCFADDAAPSALADEAAPPAPAVLLRAEGVTLAYGDTVVQHDLRFEVKAGEVLAIGGASGCGKSTLLRCLVGLHPPAQGRVVYGRHDLYASEPDGLTALRRCFGVMFQAGALWSSMTVGENVMLPLQMAGETDPAAREREARFKLALVGLDRSFDAEPAALSGGMRKRAAIARALVLDPALLFLDEPSAGLDPIASADLDALIAHLCRDLGTTVVMVSHELDSIFTVAHRLLFLDAETRSLGALGPPEALSRDGPAPVRNFLRQGPRR